LSESLQPRQGKRRGFGEMIGQAQLATESHCLRRQNRRVSRFF